MWSIEGRTQNAHQLRQLADRVLRDRQLCDRFAGDLQPEIHTGKLHVQHDPPGPVYITEVSYVAHPEPR